MCVYLACYYLFWNFERLDVLVKFIDDLLWLQASSEIIKNNVNYICGIYIVSIYVVKATVYRAKLVKLSVFLLSWKTGKYPGQKVMEISVGDITLNVFSYLSLLFKCLLGYLLEWNLHFRNLVITIQREWSESVETVNCLIITSKEQFHGFGNTLFYCHYYTCYM